VNIIAHSMGGLDARYAIAKLGIASKVASLTTIGTPHRGTPLADVGARVLGDGLGVRRVLTKLGLGLDGVSDLTTDKMREFNTSVADARGVAYACVVSAVAGGVRGVNTLLAPTYLFLRDRAGRNDGIVPASSQHWGEVLLEIDADHWAQIGWSGTYDALKLYSELFHKLRERGF
jgi:triacylglycerol lipase